MTHGGSKHDPAATIMTEDANKLHLVVMHDIHVDDLAVLIGDNFCQSENFTRLDCLVHDIAPPDRNFCINSTFRCSYSHRCIR